MQYTNLWNIVWPTRAYICKQNTYISLLPLIDILEQIFYLK